MPTKISTPTARSQPDQHYTARQWAATTKSRSRRRRAFNGRRRIMFDFFDFWLRSANQSSTSRIVDWTPKCVAYQCQILLKIDVHFIKIFLLLLISCRMRQGRYLRSSSIPIPSCLNSKKLSVNVNVQVLKFLMAF